MKEYVKHYKEVIQDDTLSRDDLLDIVRDLLDSVALMDVVVKTRQSDMTYSNTISYSPSSIREEVEHLMNKDFFPFSDGDEYDTAFKWALEATDDELNMVASCILDVNDELWSMYRDALINGLVEYVCRNQ